MNHDELVVKLEEVASGSLARMRSRLCNDRQRRAELAADRKRHQKNVTAIRKALRRLSQQNPPLLGKIREKHDAYKQVLCDELKIAVAGANKFGPSRRHDRSIDHSLV